MDSHIKHSLFACFFDLIIHFFLRFIDHFFNACRMNPSVNNQLFKRNSGNLTPNRIKSGKDDRFRRIVNNEVYARSCFQSSYVTAFLPIILPFISSLGRLTTETLLSCNMVCCTFCIASDRIFLAFYQLHLSLFARYRAASRPYHDALHAPPFQAAILLPRQSSYRYMLKLFELFCMDRIQISPGFCDFFVFPVNLFFFLINTV